VSFDDKIAAAAAAAVVDPAQRSHNQVSRSAAAMDHRWKQPIEEAGRAHQQSTADTLSWRCHLLHYLTLEQQDRKNDNGQVTCDFRKPTKKSETVFQPLHDHDRFSLQTQTSISFFLSFFYFFFVGFLVLVLVFNFN
jgi:hypothetical protein